MERLPLFATAARGTEALLAEELTELGAKKVRKDRGRVRFVANLREALRICLWTRIGMRVLYPVGETQVRGREGLYEAALALPWEEHLTTDSTFAVDATIKDTEHQHSGFVALRIKDAIADRLRQKRGARPDVDTRNPAVKIVAHLHRDQLALSLDVCGESLNRRGYRRGSFVAPLKETLASAILRAAKYQGEEPLFDPMCGSGTFLIEGAWIAARRAPNLAQTFGIERWPTFGEEARNILTELRTEARQQERTPPFPIIGMDKSEESIEAAKLNASAAKLGRAVKLELGDATGPLPVDPQGPGLLVTNPPYGARLEGAGGQKGMKSFYFKLGDSLGALSGWRKFILSGNPAFESAFHQRPMQRAEMWNGPIECELLTYSERTLVQNQP